MLTPKEIMAEEESDKKGKLKLTEFLILFQWFGHSFLGLLLAELGWTSIVVLSTKLVAGLCGWFPRLECAPVSEKRVGLNRSPRRRCYGR